MNLEASRVRSVVALVIVAGGFTLIGATWLLRGSAESERLTTTLVGLIGIVAGYYFGREGVDDAEERLSAAHENGAVVLRRAEEEHELATNQLGKLRAARSTAEEYSLLMERIDTDPELREKVYRIVDDIRSENR